MKPSAEACFSFGGYRALVAPMSSRCKLETQPDRVSFSPRRPRCAPASALQDLCANVPPRSFRPPLSLFEDGVRLA